MDPIEFVHLSEVREEDIIQLMNNERTARYLPLRRGEFTREDCRAFLAAKQRFWDENGFGPWAILIAGCFAGWGGLQPSEGDADFGLVLHPKYWGWGRRIFERVKEEAFGPMGLDSITVLLPPVRHHTGAIARLGFARDKDVEIDGEVFLRYRLARR